MRGSRRIAVPVVAVLALGLAACAPALPESVVPDSAISVGWTGQLTSVNAAASPTAGNIDVAETIRGDFGDLIDGEFVADEGFGTVSIVEDEPFTVRYDLAEPSWSDGIPLDAADLLLGWAGAAGFFDQDAEAAADDAAPAVPTIDEFARSIDVTSAQPSIGWQRAVSAPVPAHVVGRRAFGTDDPMEAKQEIIRAIQQDDTAALEKIATVWNEGFEISPGKTIPADLLLSSGPYRVDGFTADGDGGAQSVVLVPNTAYRGLVTPKVARIDLVPPGDDPIAVVGDTVDVVQLAPVTANRDRIQALERQDFAVSTTGDGTVWAMLLNPAGIFTSQQARTAFIHAAPANALVARGSGAWSSAYTGTTSMISAPGSRVYDIVNEDSGFASTLGAPGDDPALEREAAGVTAGARVCVLYDRGSEFAAGAFAALREAAAEGGWDAADCGTDDIDGAIGQGGWDAVITRVPIPQTPAEMLAQWGSQGTASITRQADPERDALIAQLEQTTDIYDARELTAQIEATIVRASVALPLALNPLVTIADRGVTGVTPRNGATAPLTYGVVQWAALAN